jgi:hypothetical protein
VRFTNERELVTLNEKPLRALKEHQSTKEHKSTVTGQVCSGALGDHMSTAEHKCNTD